MISALQQDSREGLEGHEEHEAAGDGGYEGEPALSGGAGENLLADAGEHEGDGREDQSANHADAQRLTGVDEAGGPGHEPEGERGEQGGEHPAAGRDGLLPVEVAVRHGGRDGDGGDVGYADQGDGHHVRREGAREHDGEAGDTRDGREDGIELEINSFHRSALP